MIYGFATFSIRRLTGQLTGAARTTHGGTKLEDVGVCMNTSWAVLRLSVRRPLDEVHLVVVGVERLEVLRHFAGEARLAFGDAVA